MLRLEKRKTVLSVVVLVLVLPPDVECGCFLFLEKARCEGGIPASLPLSLRALDVSDSSFHDWTALSRLENLEELDMDRCGVDRLPLGVFPQLQRLVRLDLSGNSLTSISRDAFQLNAKLRLLSLSSNPLQLDASSPFLVSYSVTKLQLRDCGIRQVSSVTFRDMKALRFLDLSENRIMVLHSGSFSHNAELRIVDLSLNDLSRVDSDIFAANTKLVDVNLSGNNLSLDAETPFLVSSSIEILLLENCGIRRVTNVTFSQMGKLRNLTLSGNPLLTLDPTYFRSRSSSVTLRVDCDADADVHLALLEVVCGGNNVTVYCDGRHPGKSPATELRCDNRTRKRQLTVTARREELEDRPASAAGREEPVTLVATEGTTTTSSSSSTAEDRAFVLFCSSLALASAVLSATVLVIFLKSRKGKANEKPQPRPEDLIMLDETDVLLPPPPHQQQRPLPTPPATPSLHSNHEYEEISATPTRNGGFQGCNPAFYRVHTGPVGLFGGDHSAAERQPADLSGQRHPPAPPEALQAGPLPQPAQLRSAPWRTSSTWTSGATGWRVWTPPPSGEPSSGKSSSTSPAALRKPWPVSAAEASRCATCKTTSSGNTARWPPPALQRKLKVLPSPDPWKRPALHRNLKVFRNLFPWNPGPLQRKLEVL